MERRKEHRRTIFRRMLMLLLAVMLTQMVIYLLVFIKGGLLEQTEENAFSILVERTANRKLDLENDMVGGWTYLANGESDVLESVGEILSQNGITAEMLLQDQALSQQVAARSAESMITMLRRNGVTGAFLVLDSSGEKDTRPGVYIRDYDPTSYSSDNADLLLERGLPEISRNLGVTMDSYWSAFFRFEGRESEATDFFFAPVQAARAVELPYRQSRYFGYWSGAFSLSGLDRAVVTYSIPLIWEDGTVLGVLGVDLTIDYLTGMLNYEELGENRTGAYFLGISRDGGETYQTICSSGPNFHAYFGQPQALAVTPDRHSGIVTIAGTGKQTVYGARQDLKLYDTNTPFVGDQWALMGIMSQENLLVFPHRIQTLLLLSTLISLALGMGLIFLASRSFTKPISALAKELKCSDPSKPIRLRRVHVAEIDALTDAVEELSNAAAESAARISKIMEMSHIPIGVFEYRRGGERVFCSRRLFEVLGWADWMGDDAYLPEAEFAKRLDAITQTGHETEELVYCLPWPTGRDHWVQLFYREEPDCVLGAFLDVTEDMETKRRMEYERDFDVLTGLYNRRAFDQRVYQLFGAGKEVIGKAALLMLDLDNLKYVNDTYGHDYGDRYLQAFAHCMESFYQYPCLVGRRSGDEFNVFLYGCTDQETVRERVRRFWALVGETYVGLPDGERIRVRASGGLAWYPIDAEDYEELLRRADFAMYSIKRTVKGIVQEFDAEEYRSKSILIQGQDELNQMLDRRLVRYAMQPVVSASDGSIYGYEMLMRPIPKRLADLDNLFLLAKAQSKLLQIEELTWFEAMETFAVKVKNGEIAPEAKVFINSIGSQSLTHMDIAKLEARYAELLSRVVIEVTENEEAGSAITSQKRQAAVDWGGMLALDDYGSGFNSEKVMVEVAPDMVKVDCSIIRGIDKDPNRRALLKNLVGYAKERGILVLAEGVETAGELDTLIACGIDFLQGFYLARPEFEVSPLPAQRVEEIQRLYRKYHGKG